jgi:hypothetical protein
MAARKQAAMNPSSASNEDAPITISSDEIATAAV